MTTPCSDIREERYSSMHAQTRH